MANPIVGELDVKDGDKTYRLVLDINAFIEAEVVLGKTTDKIVEELKSGATTMGTVRGVLYGALQEHHPGITLIETGKIMGRVGIDVIGDALNAAFPDAPKGGSENPPKRARRSGTGKRS